MTTFVNGNQLANLIAQGAAGVNNFDIPASVDVAIDAQGGNDTIDLGGLGIPTSFTIAGGSGNDDVIAPDGVDESTVYLGAGNDLFASGGPILNSLVQSASGTNEFLVGGQVTNSFLVGGTDVDFFDTGDLFGSLIAAGAGNDTVDIVDASATSIIFLGEGDDVFNANGGTLTSSYAQSATGNNLFVNFSLETGSIIGGTGNDTIDLDGGDMGPNSLIAAGAGNDEITVDDATNSVIFMGEGNDTVFLDVINNTLVQSSSGANTFDLTSGTGVNTTINGGTGSDTVNFNTDTFTAAGTEFNGIEAFWVDAGGAYTLSEANEAAGVNTITVNDAAGAAFTSIDASAYSNTISIQGGEGDDDIEGGDGADVLTGNGSVAGDFYIYNTFSQSNAEVTDFITEFDAAVDDFIMGGVGSFTAAAPVTGTSLAEATANAFAGITLTGGIDALTFEYASNEYVAFESAVDAGAEDAFVIEVGNVVNGPIDITNFA